MHATRSGPFRFLPGMGALCVLLLSAFVLGVVAPTAAADIKVVSGIVESISGTHVSLGGKTYDLEGVRILHPSGRRLSISDVARGNKVDVFFQSRRITSVVVYDPMLE